MKKTYLLMALLCMVCGTAGIVRGDIVTRSQGEAAADFARRYAPKDSEMTEKVVETEVFGAKRAVIAFYKLEFQAKYDYTEVHGYLYIPRDGDEYDRILINNFEEEGATPKIEAVFFANADKDAARELIVICSWRQEHYDVDGTLYATYIFDDIGRDKIPERLTYLKKISERVSGGCDCNYRDKTKPDKRFETAVQVRTGLKKLGYR
ncbi:MAG: hypothetical protein ABJA02_07145 [Acidobacteriota bacterium]